MKILLRNYDGKKYVWRNARWNKGVYEVEDELLDYYAVRQTSIIAVDEDNRGGYVVCNNCGEMIQNTPEAIEAHFAAKEAGRDCLGCRHLGVHRVLTNKNTSYTKNEDGSYAISETYNAKLGCYIHWSTYPLGSPEAEQRCIFRQCRVRGVKKIDDIFIKYPNVFNTHLTVDTIIKNNYAYEGGRNGYLIYDLKCRGSLKACVNGEGIIECYECHSRGDVYYMHYSSTHNKLFFEYCDKYDENYTDFITENKKDMFLKRLKKLYEEAEA